MTDHDRELYRAASRLMLLARDLAEMAADGQGVPERVWDELERESGAVRRLRPVVVAAEDDDDIFANELGDPVA